jgi:hypothetical protein
MKHKKKLPRIYFRYDLGKLPEEKLRPVRNWKEFTLCHPTQRFVCKLRNCLDKFGRLIPRSLGPNAESHEYNAKCYTFYILILSSHLCLRRPLTARLVNKYFNYWIAQRYPRAHAFIQRGKTQPSASNISRNYKLSYISLSTSEFFHYIRLEFDGVN